MGDGVGAGDVVTETGDDGALYRLWRYIEARRRLRLPPLDLEDVAVLKQAVADAEEGDA